jgi:hypothetical protein
MPIHRSDHLMTKLNEKNKEQAMNTIDALYCDVDDFNKVFYPEWERLQLTNGSKKRRRKGIMTHKFIFINHIIKILRAIIYIMFINILEQNFHNC